MVDLKDSEFCEFWAKLLVYYIELPALVIVYNTLVTLPKTNASNFAQNAGNFIKNVDNSIQYIPNSQFDRSTRGLAYILTKTWPSVNNYGVQQNKLNDHIAPDFGGV